MQGRQKSRLWSSSSSLHFWAAQLSPGSYIWANVKMLFFSLFTTFKHNLFLCKINWGEIRQSFCEVKQSHVWRLNYDLRPDTLNCVYRPYVVLLQPVFSNNAFRPHPFILYRFNNVWNWSRGIMKLVEKFNVWPVYHMCNVTNTNYSEKKSIIWNY